MCRTVCVQAAVRTVRKCRIKVRVKCGLFYLTTVVCRSLPLFHRARVDIALGLLH